MAIVSGCPCVVCPCYSRQLLLISPLQSTASNCSTFLKPVIFSLHRVMCDLHGNLPSWSHGALWLGCFVSVPRSSVGPCNYNHVSDVITEEQLEWDYYHRLAMYQWSEQTHHRQQPPGRQSSQKLWNISRVEETSTWRGKYSNMKYVEINICWKYFSFFQFEEFPTSFDWVNNYCIMSIRYER